MNSQIKAKVKKAIGNQVIEKDYKCPNCNSDVKVKIIFKEDKIICTKCRSDFPIDDGTYKIIEQQFKKMGIF
ncbi:hypothetical protein P9E76_15370 [Schinkia azotoformans]|uniref:Uncharacterized protein n=1 Tax=Schinkia azotoformans LMG 9581 TaxID=1131731 RepID=K6D6C5_SCHAZ|nr:hypothetical protein [Schinkia azotoformans]EKN68052.1 hypothetical protein BAZO_06029 [Schinkia azotoformans LMG 9581]MEC1638142.1 hypothetical protein [Schinkia azotoformans]MEC1946424.1 hypothetical protein [Schinkia azotoformans]HHW36246.1 hypothetical protein [Bacillales bacterium]